MNYRQLREVNGNSGFNLPIKDHNYRNASMSVNNEQLSKIAENEKQNGFNARQSSVKQRHEQPNLPIKMSIKRDSFYNGGGTYKTIFKPENAVIDPLSNKDKIMTYRALKETNRDHHKTALLDRDYRNIYDIKGSDKP
jgi:hypothetical protein